MLRPRTPLTLAALALLSGCVPPSIRGNSWGNDVASGTGAVTIEVTNDLALEAKVYLLQSAEYRMLGTVLAQRTNRFSVPARVICGFEVRLSMVPVDGSHGFTTEDFVTWPGQRLAFKLEANGAFRFSEHQ